MDVPSIETFFSKADLEISSTNLSTNKVIYYNIYNFLL